jgi:hypothetical protein
LYPRQNRVILNQFLRQKNTMPDMKTDLRAARAKMPPSQPPKTFFGRFRNLIYVFISGGLTYFALSYYLENRVGGAGGDSDRIDYTSAHLPGRVAPTVSVHRERNPGNVKLTLYQYVTCPFCCKVRAYLDYFGYSYDIVEVNSITKKQIDWSGYKKVPILAVQLPTGDANADPNNVKYDENIIVSHIKYFLVESILKM